MVDKEILILDHAKLKTKNRPQLSMTKKHYNKMVRQWHLCQQMTSSLGAAIQLFSDIHANHDKDLMRRLHECHFFMKNRLRTSASQAIAADFVAKLKSDPELSNAN